MAIVLDTVNKKLEIVLAGAVAANQLPFVVGYADYIGATPAFTPGANDGVTNDAVVVTLVATPAVNTQRMISSISVWNEDTAPATVTIHLDNTGTDREIIRVVLAVGDSLHYTGEQWQIFKPNPLDGLYEAYVCVRDKKAQNTAGGQFTSGAWRRRDINDEQADAAGICTIAANQIILAAGTYRCLISAPAYKTSRHQLRLYNTTDAAVLLVGTSMMAYNLEYAVTRSTIVGRFTVAAGKALEVQHQAQITRAVDGYGIEANFTDEIYAVAEFWREA